MTYICIVLLWRLRPRLMSSWPNGSTGPVFFFLISSLFFLFFIPLGVFIFFCGFFFFFLFWHTRTKAGYPIYFSFVYIR